MCSSDLLTNFSGNQDDAVLARRIALAQIDAGADILYTMLNAGRSGAIEACRERRVPQIGNVRDWVAVMPEVFVASAVADSANAVFAAARDWAQGRWQPDSIRRIGLEDPQSVRLTLGAGVPAAVRGRLEELRGLVVAGTITIPETYGGPEFSAG